MNPYPGLALHLAVALGIGRLIAAERERRKGEGPSRSSAGIRTFALAALTGGITLELGGTVLLVIAFAGLFILPLAATSEALNKTLD